MNVTEAETRIQITFQRFQYADMPDMQTYNKVLNSFFVNITDFLLPNNSFCFKNSNDDLSQF